MLACKFLSMLDYFLIIGLFDKGQVTCKHQAQRQKMHIIRYTLYFILFLGFKVIGLGSGHGLCL